MKKMKKILAMLLALTMVLGMSLTSMADVGLPKEGNSKDVTVSNVEAGSKLNAYQLIDAVYAGENKDEGFVKYVWDFNFTYENADGDLVTITEGSDVVFDELGENIPLLTSELVTQLAANSTVLANWEKDVPEVTVDSNSTSAVMNLDAGTWMILVTPADSAVKVYNPMIASVYYVNSGSDDTMNEGEDATVNAGGSWELETTNAYTKSSPVAIDKVFVTANTDTAYETPYLDWVAFDDVITYKVTTTVPDYSDEYLNAVFKIYDGMENGLVLDTTKDITVKANEVELAAEKYTLTSDTHSLEVAFDSEWILDNANAVVEIEYSAKVTESATLNDDSNDNKVVLTYTDKPNSTKTTEPIRIKVYTFGTDKDIKKVDEKGVALPGATFTLTNNDTNKVYTSVSDESGDVCFNGLDVGTYTLKETIAPNGYTINGEEFTVVVSAEYDNTGKTKTSHSIKIVESVDEQGNVTYAENVTITNTKLNALPSTGGIGTTIFTVAGCGIMIAAAFFFFASRKKEN